MKQVPRNPRPRCAHIAAGKNTFPGFKDVSAFVCVECDKSVEPPSLDPVEINDDMCQWYTFGDAEPIAVMRCDGCGRHSDFDEDGVACSLSVAFGGVGENHRAIEAPSL